MVAIDSGGLITKGDNNLATDQEANIAAGPITASCLEGQVVFVVPYLEKLAFLPYDANYILAAAILALLILSELYGSRKSNEEPQAVSP